MQKLSRGILSIEASSDCIPPRRLAARVQALLRRSGWEGWRVSVRSGGPCGSVSERIGDGSREVSGNGGNLDYETRRVIVHAGPYPSTQKLLDRLEVPLMEMSSKLCYTQAALRREVRRRLARTRRHVAFEVIERKVGEWSHERQARLDAGCALVAVARSAIDGFGIVVVIEQNG